MPTHQNIVSFTTVIQNYMKLFKTVHSKYHKSGFKLKYYSSISGCPAWELKSTQTPPDCALSYFVIIRLTFQFHRTHSPSWSRGLPPDSWWGRWRRPWWCHRRTCWGRPWWRRPPSSCWWWSRRQGSWKPSPATVSCNCQSIFSRVSTERLGNESWTPLYLIFHTWTIQNMLLTLMSQLRWKTSSLHSKMLPWCT